MEKTAEQPRERRQWWIAVDGTIKQAEGHSCAPANPDYWFFPRIGSSLAEGVHLFATENAARAIAIEQCQIKIGIWTKKLAKAEGRDHE